MDTKQETEYVEKLGFWEQIGLRMKYKKEKKRNIN